MTTDRAGRRLLPAVLAGTVGLIIAVHAAPRATPGAQPSAAITAWALPVRDGQQVDLVAAPDGSLLLSWVEGAETARRLRVARLAHGRWSAPSTVAAGDTFGTATDTPRVRQTPDGAIWATWLRRNPAGGHARDIVIARSVDGGRAWSVPAAVNDDGTATEHGFVSSWPVGRDRLGMAWLDGRAKSGHAGHGGDAAQMLRTVTFDGTMGRHDESVLDARVCDCCHTDIAMTEHGPLLVYRDRSATEVRDIHAMRLERGHWSASRPVHADGWVMPGCPVNGPAVAADGSRAAVAWYTGVAGEPEVRLVTSLDAGGRFTAPMRLDRGAGVMGRVDVAVQGDRAIALWLREDGDAQSLWLATTRVGSTAPARPVRIAAIEGRGRGTGMPRIALASGVLHVVWTDVRNGRPALQGARVTVR